MGHRWLGNDICSAARENERACATARNVINRRGSIEVFYQTAESGI